MMPDPGTGRNRSKVLGAHSGLADLESPEMLFVVVDRQAEQSGPTSSLPYVACRSGPAPAIVIQGAGPGATVAARQLGEPCQDPVEI